MVRNQLDSVIHLEDSIFDSRAKKTTCASSLSCLVIFDKYVHSFQSNH